MEGVGIVKDEELNLEEMEASLTIGGAGRGYVAVIGGEQGRK